MLSEFEVAHFISRIDDVLSSPALTDWQRCFLADIRGKISRYGVRTEKQLSKLTRLTKGPTEPDPKVPDNPDRSLIGCLHGLQPEPKALSNEIHFPFVTHFAFEIRSDLVTC